MIKTIYNYFARGQNPYNASKYWKRRAIVVNKECRLPKIIKLYYLIYLRKVDSFNCAAISTGINTGAEFASPPNLPHGLNGIVIHPTAQIGKNVTILQQVTIGTRHENVSAVIGDGCFIGAGAKILGNITIGKNVSIGANAVVLCDVPDNCTAVGVPARIYEKSASAQDCE